MALAIALDAVRSPTCASDCRALGARLHARHDPPLRRRWLRYLLRALPQARCGAALVSTRILGKSIRDAARNKERWKRRRMPTQDPSTEVRTLLFERRRWCRGAPARDVRGP